MATRDAEALDRTLAALADPTRRAMVERLAKNGRMAISDLATPFPMSLPAVLKHVGVLTEAGIVSRVKVGRTVFCHLLSAQIRASLAWLRKYEDYQLPSESAASKAAAGPARKPRGQAGPAATKRSKVAGKSAQKAGQKAAPRAAARAQQPKAKTAGRRAKAVAPATTAQRGGGRAATGVRRQPAKVAPATTASRRRPRR